MARGEQYKRDMTDLSTDERHYLVTDHFPNGTPVKVLSALGSDRILGAMAKQVGKHEITEERC